MKIEQLALHSALSRYGRDGHALVQILRETQALTGWLPRQLLRHIADEVNLPLAHVEGVASFYRFFHTQPVGRFHILFSDSITDHMLGSQTLMSDLCARLGVIPGQVRADGRVSIDRASCTGLCDQGPALLVNHHHTITRLDQEKVAQMTDRAANICPVGAILIKRRGFAISIGERRFDGKPVAAMREEDIHSALAYHWARMIELLHAVEVIDELLDEPAILEGERMAGGTRRHEGIGVIEAPRGTLIHHYRVGDDDLVSMCNLIVATTHNNQAMNESVRSVAREYLDGHAITEGLLNHIEVAIRAYDPCLSCATHALGQMPLDITLVGPNGALLDRAIRSQSSTLQRDLTSHTGTAA